MLKLTSEIKLKLSQFGSLKKFVFTYLLKDSLVTSRKCSKMLTPALLTRRSNGPIALTAFSVASQSLRSQTTGVMFSFFTNLKSKKAEQKLIVMYSVGWNTCNFNSSHVIKIRCVKIVGQHLWFNS